MSFWSPYYSDMDLVHKWSPQKGYSMKVKPTTYKAGSCTFVPELGSQMIVKRGGKNPVFREPRTNADFNKCANASFGGVASFMSPYSALPTSYYTKPKKIQPAVISGVGPFVGPVGSPFVGPSFFGPQKPFGNVTMPAWQYQALISKAQKDQNPRVGRE